MQLTNQLNKYFGPYAVGIPALVTYTVPMVIWCGVCYGTGWATNCTTGCTTSCTTDNSSKCTTTCIAIYLFTQNRVHGTYSMGSGFRIAATFLQSSICYPLDVVNYYTHYPTMINDAGNWMIPLVAIKLDYIIRQYMTDLEGSGIQPAIINLLAILTEVSECHCVHQAMRFGWSLGRCRKTLPSFFPIYIWHYRKPMILEVCFSTGLQKRLT